MNTKHLILILTAIVLAGCGSSASDHEVKPMTSRPMPKNSFKDLKTPEEKIKFIEDSKAPDSVKQNAIDRVKSGKL